MGVWGTRNNGKLDCGDSCTTLNLLKVTLNGWVLWYVNYISKTF
jgi:hypothetical protein